MAMDPPAPMRLVRAPIDLVVLSELACSQFGDLVKAVVDVGQAMMVIGGELHADEEAYLLDAGSNQDDLWGINLYPAQYGETDWIEFDSMINMRPSRGNRSRSVDDPATQRRIVEVVGQLVRTDG